MEESNVDLNRVIDGYLNMGYRIEVQSDRSATLVIGKRPNHALHVILSFMTAGLWLLVYLIVVLTTKEKRVRVWVTPYGEVTTQKV